MAELSLIERLFDVIENDIVPKTAEGVKKGNKLFGAALLVDGGGRNRFVLSEIGWMPPVVGLILWAALLHFHRGIFGVSPLLFG